MKSRILTVALASLLACVSLSGCSAEDKGPQGAGTGLGETTAGTAADNGSGGGGQALLPRYDYMGAAVAADVELDRADYAGITLTVPNSLKVDEEDVRDYVENIRFQYRVAVNGTSMVKDKPLSMGDDAYIYYKGFLDGKEFDGGSNWDDPSPYKLGLGSGSFIPGFEEGLVGVVPNTASKERPVEVPVTFPADYHEASLAGKAVIFKVAVEYAVQYTMPEYNREMVEKVLKYTPEKDFYASDEALLEEFEAYLFNYLVKQSRSKVESAKNAAIWDHLTETAACKNLPELEVAYYFDVYESDVEYNYDYYKTYGGEQFAAQYPTVDSFAPIYLGLGEGADWKAEVTEMARGQVRRDMIIHAIAEKEGMETVTEEEYEARIRYWIDYYTSGYGSMTREELIENLGEAAIRESALQEKVNEWLAEQVTFTYEDGTALVTTTEEGA